MNLSTLDRPTICALSEAIILRAAREIIGDNPLACSRRWRKLVRRLFWARKRVRHYMEGRASHEDAMDAVQAAIVEPLKDASDDERCNAYIACRGAIGAFELLQLEGAGV